MSKELKKFQGEYKKLESGIGKFTPGNANKMVNAAKDLLKRVAKKQDSFSDATAKARANGLTGSKPSDFARDKDFMYHLGEWKKARDEHARKVTLLASYGEAAGVLHKNLTALLVNVEKDLKKRDKSSASKKDIEKLRDTLKNQAPVLQKVRNLAVNTAKDQISHVGDFNSIIRSIITKSQTSTSAATRLPPALESTDRSKNTTLATRYAGEIGELCNSALAKAEVSANSAHVDQELALPDIQRAREKFGKLKEIKDSYSKLAVKFGQAIKDATEHREILKDLNILIKDCDDAENKLKDTVTKLRTQLPGLKLSG